MRRVLLVRCDLITDVLEARQRLDDLAALGACDGCAELPRHDRLEDRRRRRQLRFVRLEQEVREQSADLVARQEDILTPLPHADADAVAVRVRADDDVRRDLLRELQAERQRALLLGIRRLHRREIPIRHFLFLHNMDIREACTREHLAHRLIARTVQGSIDDAQRSNIPLADRRLVDRLDERIDGLLAELLHERRIARGLNLRDIPHRFNALN